MTRFMSGYGSRNAAASKRPLARCAGVTLGVIPHGVARNWRKAACITGSGRRAPGRNIQPLTGVGWGLLGISDIDIRVAFLVIFGFIAALYAFAPYHFYRGQEHLFVIGKR